MTEIELMERVQNCLGKSFEEMPCYKFLEKVYGSFPPSPAILVSRGFLQVGDAVAFGTMSEDSNDTVGIYLGNGKIVASIPEHGVCIIPYRFVKEKFIRGYHFG